MPMTLNELVLLLGEALYCSCRGPSGGARSWASPRAAGPDGPSVSWWANALTCSRTDKARRALDALRARLPPRPWCIERLSNGRTRRRLTSWCPTNTLRPPDVGRLGLWSARSWGGCAARGRRPSSPSTGTVRNSSGGSPSGPSGRPAAAGRPGGRLRRLRHQHGVPSAALPPPAAAARPEEIRSLWKLQGHPGGQRVEAVEGLARQTARRFVLAIDVPTRSAFEGASGPSRCWWASPTRPIPLGQGLPPGGLLHHARPLEPRPTRRC